MRRLRRFFELADAAYRRGDPVEAARQTERARGFIEEAVALADGGTNPATGG